MTPFVFVIMGIVTHLILFMLLRRESFFGLFRSYWIFSSFFSFLFKNIACGAVTEICAPCIGWTDGTHGKNDGIELSKKFLSVCSIL